MRFGPIPTAQAVGAVLAHSMAGTHPDGSQGRLRKGRKLTAADIDFLTRSGHRTIIAAVLDEDDVPEDDAATSLARALVPEPEAVGLRLSRAATGRVNVFSRSAGVARIDATKINAFNLIDPMITVATVPEFQRMDAGGMVGTIKIISYAVPAKAVTRAADVGPALALAAPIHQTATLIETTFTPESPLPDKGRRAMAGRLARLGVSLTARVSVPHDAKAIANAITQAPGDLVMILTASATSDAHDVAPSALRLAGGTVARFGMPVDPGNLLFLGNLRKRPVIGLPGCARSPVLNGADWVLERLICGVQVTDADIAGMGVGGLLKESPARLHPRDV